MTTKSGEFDEGPIYVAEGPKKFLKNFCKTP